MVAVCRPAVLTGARKTRSRAVAPAIQHRAGERMTYRTALLVEEATTSRNANFKPTELSTH